MTPASAPAPLAFPRPRSLRGRPSRRTHRSGVQRIDAPAHGWLPMVDESPQVTRLVDLALLLTDLRTRHANARGPLREALALLIRSAEGRS